MGGNICTNIFSLNERKPILEDGNNIYTTWIMRKKTN